MPSCLEGPRMRQYLVWWPQAPSKVPPGSWAHIHLSPSLNRAQRTLLQIHSHLSPLIGRMKMSDTLKGRAHFAALSKSLPRTTSQAGQQKPHKLCADGPWEWPQGKGDLVLHFWLNGSGNFKEEDTQVISDQHGACYANRSLPFSACSSFPSRLHLPVQSWWAQFTTIKQGFIA